MTQDDYPRTTATQSLPVFPTAEFTAVEGASLGDPLGVAADLVLGDVYRLASGASGTRLAVHGPPDALRVAFDSPSGVPGAAVRLDACATFMSPDGGTFEALILVEDGRQPRVYLFPLAPVAPRQAYALVTLDPRAAPRRFAEAGCVSFTRGTRITLATGQQVPVEEIAVRDKVLTRDHGPCPVRWVGRQTVRASGAFAPIRIRAGALNNEADLIVSPDHRLFVYQRRDAVKAGRSELLVKAKYLVNGDNVTRTAGGFVEYFQLLFDAHEIIYAEGIAAESLMVDTRVRSALPDAVRAQLHSVGSDATRRDLGFEIRAGSLDAADAVKLLRQASS